MRTRPDELSDRDVLTVVVAQWLDGADGIEHLPVGFGAHHWAVHCAGERRLFVTADRLGAHHDAASLEAAYSGAAALAETLDVVVAPLPARTGARTVPVGEALALSVTPWIEGRRPEDAAGVLPLVHRLHRAEPPPALPRWRPVVPASLADDLAHRVRSPWTRGPHGESARAALTAALGVLEGGVAAYHRRAGAARARRWVVTHGEPHERNQLVTERGRRLVDWETLRLAPAERDLRWLGDPAADREMLKRFDLEWRLDEVAQYAGWFEAPHGDGPDDRVALGGLLEALVQRGGRTRRHGGG